MLFLDGKKGMVKIDMRAYHTEITVECYFLQSEDCNLSLIEGQKVLEIIDTAQKPRNFKLPVGSWQTIYNMTVEQIIRTFNQENEEGLFVKAKNLNEAKYSIKVWWRSPAFKRFYKVFNNETLTTAIILSNASNKLDASLSLTLFIQVDNSKCDNKKARLEIETQLQPSKNFC